MVFMGVNMERKDYTLFFSAIFCLVLSVGLAVAKLTFWFELFNPITLLLITLLMLSLREHLGAYRFSSTFIALGMLSLTIGEALHFVCHFVLRTAPYNHLIRFIFLLPTVCLAINETLYFAKKLNHRRRDFSTLLINSFCLASLGVMFVFKSYVSIAGYPDNPWDFTYLIFIFCGFYVIMMCVQTFYLIGLKAFFRGTNILTISIILYEIVDIWYVFSEAIEVYPDNYYLDLYYTFAMLMMTFGIILQLQNRYNFPLRERVFSVKTAKIQILLAASGIVLTIIAGVTGFLSSMEMLYIIIALMAYVIMCYLLNTSEMDEIRISKIAADEASKAKSDFLASMSHEIRTPINTILGMDEMILRETGEQSTRAYAVNIQKSAQTLLYLINDILDFSKIETGKTLLFPDEYHSGLLISELYHMLLTRATEKGLQFVVDADPALPHMLYGDSMRIRQIILNLLTNALKYTKTGEIRLSVSFRKRSEDEIDLSVAVSDTGIGIKEEDLKKLFLAFERIEEERNRTIEGTGLGMNIVARLLELMDSKLKAESEYGKGSTFSFTIVQKVVGWDGIGDFATLAAAEAKSEKYHALFTAPAAQILVVDDTDMNLFVVKGLLKNTLLKIDTAVNGKQALFLTEHQEYDLLLIDHRMPVMDGVEMIHELRGSQSNANSKKPCIVLTANAIAEARDTYLSEGFDDYLVKPVSGKALEEMLMTYLPPAKVHPADPDNEVLDVPADDNTGNLSLVLLSLDEKGYLNTREGMEYAGDERLYMDTLSLFAKTIKTKSSEIASLYEDEDWHNYQIKVHALKSSARVIGAEKLSDQARSLELAVINGDYDYIHEHTSETLAFYESYVSKLSGIS